MDLGASPARAFLEVTLPIIAPALISSWLLSFTLSLDDLVISSFVAGPGASTLPMVIYSKVKLGREPGHQRAGERHRVRGRARASLVAGYLMVRGDRRRAAESRSPAR